MMILLLPFFITFQTVAKIFNLFMLAFVFIFEFLSGRKTYRRIYSYSYGRTPSYPARRNQRNAIPTEPKEDRVTEDRVPDETIPADDAKSGAK